MTLLLQVAHRVAVQDCDGLVELRFHLELPLPSEVRRNDDEDTISQPSCAKLLENHAGLDGLAQTHLIAQEIAMRIVADDTVDDAHLMRLDVNSGGIE